MKIVFILVSLSIVFLNANGQSEIAGKNLGYTVEEVKLPGGQPGNNVNAIIQGPNGFLWFGSHAGLHRYDGYEYVTYKNVPSDSVGETTTLTFPYVENLYWDKSNMLWVCTYGGGLYRFDPTTEKFKHFKHDPKDSTSISNSNVTCAMEDANGNLWIGTQQGLNRYDPNSGKFKRYFINADDSKPFPYSDVRSLYTDKAGTFWVGTGFAFTTTKGSLMRYNEDTDSFTNYSQIPGDDQSLWGTSVRGILEDSKGNFWIAATLGLCRFDRKTEKFERMNRDPSLPHGAGTFDTKFRTIPYTIHEDKNGHLWIGSLFNPPFNLLIYDTATRQSTLLPVPSSVWNLFESSDGTIWVSGAGTGSKVYKIYPTIKSYNLQQDRSILDKFSNADYDSKYMASEIFNGGTMDDMIIDAKTGKTWIEATVNKIENGEIERTLTLLSYTNTTIRAYNFPEIKIENSTDTRNDWAAHGMAIDSTGGIWGILPTANGGLYRFDPKTETTQQYYHIPGDSTSLSSGRFVKIIIDSRGEIWAGAFNRGLNRLNPKTGKVKHYHFDDREEYDFPISIMESKDGKIWVGGHFSKDANGISFIAVIDPLSNEIRKIALPSSKNQLEILDMAQSPTSENIWFIMDPDGLGNYNPSNGRVLSWPITGMRDIEIDHEGSIWFAYTNSFARFDEALNGFEFSDQRKNSVQPRSGVVDPDGKIYFMNRSANGWVEIDPKNITPERLVNSRDIQIVDLIVQGEKVRPGATSYLPLPISSLNEITLPSDIGSFLIRFTDFDFFSASPQFQYRLFPYEVEWNKTTNSPTANYYKIPSGTYTFQVKSLHQVGLGNMTTRELKVVILPPWWKTWWAYSSYALIFVGGVFLADRFQRRRLLAKANAAAKEKELEQAREIEKAYQELKATQSQLIQSEKMASLGELTAGIAHEIQNPLNFVNNFSEVNKELLMEMNDEISKGNFNDVKEIAKNVIDNEEKIIFHGKRADGIVKGMLQHSRSSSGVKEPTDINVLADEYLRLAYHGLRAKDKSFNATMKTNFDASIGNMNVVPQDMGRVILNLITNAFYAVTERKKLNEAAFEPTVTVSTRKSGNKVEILVKDNGTGIPQRALDKIFQPFFTTKPTGQGTGLGLSMSYDIVTKAHQGEIKVSTKEGEGTEFIIVLPV